MCLCVNICEVYVFMAYFLAGVSVTSLTFSEVHKVGPEDLRVLGDSEFSGQRH